jgi:hypothetical protein
MARPGFYDHNEGINYPFLEGSVGRDPSEVSATSVQLIPKGTIVDAGFIVGQDFQFDYQSQHVYLRRVARDGNEILFQFRGNTGNLAEVEITFCRKITDEKYTTDFQLAEELPGASLDALCPSFIGFEGFLVTGDLEPLAAILGDGEEFTSGASSVIVERALVQNLANSFVRSVTVVNLDRTHATAPTGCPPVPVGPGGPFVVESCLTGDIRFSEGYNNSIDLNPADNTITINAVVGAGEGEPCEEVPVFPGETPPAGSSLLSGGPTCNEVIRSINGVGGRFFTIEGGRGVVLEPDQDAFKITVNVDLGDLAICDTE